MDPIAQFKQTQRELWANFAKVEVNTCRGAPALLRFARLTPGTRLLDVACGTGVVALTAARMGAKVTGIDLTPELIVRAKENVTLMKHLPSASDAAEFHLGDVEELPFNDGDFDMVVSQWGHMFAPRWEVALREMLRVLRPGGTIAFSTWPPELFAGGLFAISMKHALHRPTPNPAISNPMSWSEP